MLKTSALGLNLCKTRFSGAIGLFVCSSIHNVSGCCCKVGGLCLNHFISVTIGLVWLLVFTI